MTRLASSCTSPTFSPSRTITSRHGINSPIALSYLFSYLQSDGVSFFSLSLSLSLSLSMSLPLSFEPLADISFIHRSQICWPSRRVPGSSCLIFLKEGGKGSHCRPDERR